MQINTKEYVQALLYDGCSVRTAEKFARVIARPGIAGEVITTYVSTGLAETTNTVKSDPETGRPDWVLTMAKPDGTPVVDANGHTNTYIIPDKTFQKKYEVGNDHVIEVNGEKVYKPKGGPQEFIQIHEDISFTAFWGETQNIATGGYLNITNENDIYGIAEKEFYETYRFTAEPPKMVT